jgi:mRNA interferase MazF
MQDTSPIRYTYPQLAARRRATGPWSKFNRHAWSKFNRHGQTSSPYADAKAVRLANSDFEKGSLRVVSYARPGKLFTANRQLLVSEVGILNDRAFSRLLDAVVGVLRPAGK